MNKRKMMIVIIIILVVAFALLTKKKNNVKRESDNSEDRKISDIIQDEETGEYIIYNQETGEEIARSKNKESLYIYRIDSDYNPRSLIEAEAVMGE